MALSKASNVSSLLPKLKSEKRTCETHGEYTASSLRVGQRDVWSGCPVCTKEKQDAETSAMLADMEKERRASALTSMLGHAAIPKRFLNRTLENYAVENDGQRQALHKCSKYAQNWRENMERGTSLILCGNPGTGKTHLAIGIAQHIMAEGGTALFTRTMDMIRTVRETYSRESTRTERQVIAEYTRPDLLILDEVGHQFGSDAEKLTLFDVINARYEQCKPTILITNLDMNGLRVYLDDRAMDRLREGGGSMIPFDWGSQRAKY